MGNVKIITELTQSRVWANLVLPEPETAMPTAAMLLGLLVYSERHQRKKK